MFSLSRFRILLQQADSTYLLLLATMFMVLLPHLFRLPLWLSLYCLGLLGWRLLYQLGTGQLPRPFVRLLMMLIAMTIVATHYQTIVGREAGTAVLLIMFCLKLTEMKSTRDVYVIVYLGYFIIITGFLFSQSMLVALLMLIAVLGLTATLVAVQHPVSLIAQTQHLKLSARMLLYSIPLALVIFVLFPRTSGPLWGLPADAHSATTGLSDDMSPGRISQLANSTRVAFRAKFDSQLPPPANRYWRGPVLWHFDGRRWTSPIRQRLITNDYTFTPVEPLFNYTLTLQPHNNYWLLALDLPVTKPLNSRLSADYLLLADKPVREVMRYQLQSSIQYTLGRYDNVSMTRYLALPVSFSPRTRELINQWRDQQSKLTDMQLVNKALAFFAQQPFYYTRTPPLLFDDPVDEFIFSTRKGYCEHYASAFTVMMRMAGIPSRVVTGYFGGEVNPLDDYLVIRQSDAHAWSEVYIEGKGWLRIDPTSVIPANRIENTDDVVRIQPESDKAVKILKDTSWLYRSYKTMHNLVDSINNSWTQWVIGYNNKKQVALFEAIGIPEISWRGLTTVMFSLLAVLLSLFSYQLLKAQQKTDPLTRLYRRFCRKMLKLGLQKRANETANQFAQRITQQHPSLKSEVLKITLLYNNLRYAKYSTQQQLDNLKTMIRQLGR